MRKATVKVMNSKAAATEPQVEGRISELMREVLVELGENPQIAETLQQVLRPKGVGVIVEARHFCMMMRGVEKQHSGTVTSSMQGAFRERKETRDEFLALCRESASRF